MRQSRSCFNFAKYSPILIFFHSQTDATVEARIRIGWNCVHGDCVHVNIIEFSPLQLVKLHRESKKQDTKLLALTSLTIIRFSQFFSLADSVVNLQQIYV